MKITHRVVFNFLIFFITLFGLFFITNKTVYAISRIVNKVEITSVSGLKLIKQDDSSEGKSTYKLVDIPSNIGVSSIKLINKSTAYRFSDDKILIDSSGNPVSNLGNENYTLILNTKELGQIYKILNKTETGYDVLDIKVTYNNYKNMMEIHTNHNSIFSNSEVTVFKNDAKIGSTKLDDNGKGNIHVDDINNLTTSTYTILAKRGSEIVGIDAFHINPTYRELNIRDNIKFNIISQISNKLNILISPESGININDKVYVSSVYDESNPNENLLLNLDYKQNEILNLQGEIVLKNTLTQDKNYKVRLIVNGIELDSQDDCDVNIKNLDMSKVKVTAIEKIGKDLRVDLSGIDNLTNDDLIEVVALYDIKNKEQNLVSPCKLSNKVNTVDILGKIDASNSYELLLKINNFNINAFGVEVIPVDLSGAIAMTDVISDKIFLSLENSKGLKFTDNIKVMGVYKEGGDAKNLLKSNYNTTIDKLNGSVFINQALDTKNNYFVKFRINDIELDNLLKVTVNNNISFRGASIKSKHSSHEVEICLKNVDCISNYDQLEVHSVFNLNDTNFNLLDRDKGYQILKKKGMVYLKGAIIQGNKYGVRFKVNGVYFDDIVHIEIQENDGIKDINAYFTNEHKLVLDLKEFNIDSNEKIQISSIKQKIDGKELLEAPLSDFSFNDGKLEFITNIDFKNDEPYILVLNVFKNENMESKILEFKVRSIDSENKYELLDEKNNDFDKKYIDLNNVEFGDCNIKFKHNLDENLKYNQGVCYIPNIDVKVEDVYIIVNNLIPSKVYKELKLEIKNENGQSTNLYLPEFKCIESNDDIKNFISNAYINVNNGSDKNENSIEFADESEFWYWFNKIINKETDLRNFLFSILKDKEFSQKYIDNSEKIKILYRIIFGNSPSDQSLNIWLNDFNKTLKNEEMSKSLRILIEKMCTNVKFKSLEKQLKEEVKEK